MSNPRRFAYAAVAVTIGAATCLSGALTSAADATTPSVPAHVQISAATPSSFTVHLRKSAHAKKYVVWASKNERDVFYVNLHKSRKGRARASAKHPTITVRGLSYTANTYWYRVAAVNGSHSRVSPIRQAHVAPRTPGSVRTVRTYGGGIALTWSGASVRGYDVVQGTDSSLHANRVHYRINGRATQFTPYKLSQHRTYYFKVRARNGSSKSHYSSVVRATYSASQQPVRVLTFNVLHSMFDGKQEQGFKSGHYVQPWSKRLPAVISLIKSGHPDVININEAFDWIKPGKVRQIDTIKSALGSGWSLARTENFPQDRNPRTGNYILFRNSEFSAVGSRGHFAVSNGNLAAYQELQSRAGARFLFVSAHLSPGGDSVDSRRASETRNLLASAQSKARGVPIIYAGDFNSFTVADRLSYTGATPRPKDSPETLLRAAHVGDAYVAAQSRSGTQYGSVNYYARTPNYSGRIIDHIFGSAGVSFQNWAQLLHLSHGKFAGTIPSDHNAVVAGIDVTY